MSDGRRSSGRGAGGGAGGRGGGGAARWERRWVAGLAVRAIVTGVPFLVAVAAIAVAGHRVPRPDGGAAVAAWYAALCAGSWALMWLVHGWLHRLLPLAGLLEMSLLFPEHAPSRVRLARRVASRRDLDELMSGDVPRDETTQEAAERILALVSALRDHDRGTRGHSERVRALTDLVATRLGLGEDDRDRLRWAALLHDIGKLRVPTTLLNKPGFPTPSEWEVLRNHPHHGEELVRPLLGWLGEWGAVVVQHHEKFDGTGYPRGLAGEQICLGARIVAVADAFDVMTAARAYKKPSGRAAALRELVACSGSHFDPQVVRALIDVPQRQLLLTLGPISWLTGLPFVGQSPSTLGATLTSQTTVAAGAIALTGTATLAPLGLVSSASPEAPAHRPPAVTRKAGPAGHRAPKPKPVTGKGHRPDPAAPTAGTTGTVDGVQVAGAPDPTDAADPNGPPPPDGPLPPDGADTGGAATDDAPAGSREPRTLPTQAADAGQRRTTPAPAPAASSRSHPSTSKHSGDNSGSSSSSSSGKGSNSSGKGSSSSGKGSSSSGKGSSSSGRAQHASDPS